METVRRIAYCVFFAATFFGFLFVAGLGLAVISYDSGTDIAKTATGYFWSLLILSGVVSTIEVAWRKSANPPEQKG